MAPAAADVFAGMGKIYESITPALRTWLDEQHVFFVATAPLAQTGHVNCSPKGCDTFRVLGPRQVAYLDYNGSGIETIAHVQENGRVVLMFCAFAGAPKIVRLHGRGSIVYPDDAEFAALALNFPGTSAPRSIVRVDVTRISDSCGFGVPLLDYKASRTTMDEWAGAKGETELAAYRAQKNNTSIDGLPGYRSR